MAQLDAIVVAVHGIARLLGKSVRERTDELIGIAHPKHFSELEAAARERYYPG